MTHRSDALAESQGRTENVLVLDAFANQGDGSGKPTPYSRATVSMESFDVHQVKPHGGDAVLGASLETWQAEYGEGSASQRGYVFENPPIPGMEFGGTRGGGGQIEVSRDLEIPITEAIDVVGMFLPADAVLEQTYFAPPSPTGPIGLRTNIWMLPSLSLRAMTMLYVNGGEESGIVSRILMTTE